MDTKAATATTDVEAQESFWSRVPWEKVPLVVTFVGFLGCIIGYSVDRAPQFSHSYLVAFMFFLSIALGGLFMVIIHHLFDAWWSVPIRRVSEQLACLLPWMALFFIPIWFMAKELYPWMSMKPGDSHSLDIKSGMFNESTWFIVSVALFAIWGLWSHKLRGWSLKQDETGAAECTIYMRRWSASGIFVFAFTITAGAIFWVKSQEHQWFSTMYGVYYFAGSVWVTLGTTYAIALVMKRTDTIPIIAREQLHCIAQWLFAFTVFYAYIHFSQYFLQWNAAMPEETFWYAKREQGTWAYVCWVIILGHFLVPFLTLLRIDAKLSLGIMIPVIGWVWLMHYTDMVFNIMPLIHKDGPALHISDIAAVLFIGGGLTLIFLHNFRKHAPFPQKDPRMGEVLKNQAHSH